MIVDLTMLANLLVADVPEHSPKKTRKAAAAKTPPSRKALARPAPKRKTRKAPVSGPGHEAPAQEEAGEEDRG